MQTITKMLQLVRRASLGRLHPTVAMSLRSAVGAGYRSLIGSTPADDDEDEQVPVVIASDRGRDETIGPVDDDIAGITAVA